MAGRKRGVKTVDIIVLLALIIFVIWAFVPGVGPNLLGKLRGNDDSASYWGTQRSQRLLQSSPKTPLIEALKELPVAPFDDTEYKRESFGPSWADVDRNGCDTRNDILQRDLKNIEIREGTRGCVVARGSFVEPYTGKLVHFEKGPRSQEVQIDHVVALSNAWHTGALHWDDKQRLEFANDPLNLLAVDGPSNQDKEAKSADQWLPPNEGFHCGYVARQVAVKTKWKLWVTQAEKNAMIDIAIGCPDEPLPNY